MYTVAACYVVLVARVDKQVGISAGIYTGFINERVCCGKQVS
jgi:hypothetical protein